MLHFQNIYVPYNLMLIEIKRIIENICLANTVLKHEKLHTKNNCIWHLLFFVLIHKAFTFTNINFSWGLKWCIRVDAISFWYFLVRWQYDCILVNTLYSFMPCVNTSQIVRIILILYLMVLFCVLIVKDEICDDRSKSILI